MQCIRSRLCLKSEHFQNSVIEYSTIGLAGRIADLEFVNKQVNADLPDLTWPGPVWPGGSERCAPRAGAARKSCPRP